MDNQSANASASAGFGVGGAQVWLLERLQHIQHEQLLQQQLARPVLAQSAAIALCTALAASSISMLSPTFSGCSTALATGLVRDAALAILFVVLVPLAVAVIAAAIGQEAEAKAAEYQLEWAFVGAFSFLVAFATPRLYVPADIVAATNVRKEDEPSEEVKDWTPKNAADLKQTVAKGLKDSKAAQAKAASEPRDDDAIDDGPLDFNIYEPGPGFFKYHFMNISTLLAAAFTVAVAYLVSTEIVELSRPPLAVALGCVAVAPLLYLLWRSLSFGARYPLLLSFQYLVGIALTGNFVVFWAMPIFMQGQSFKVFLHKLFRIPYRWLDESTTARAFAAKYIYSNPVHADFFATFVFVLIGKALSLITVFYWQLAHGSLPWWLVYGYYFAWVGFGGRVMGAAYTFAHKEGHNRVLYRKWLRNSVGNIFECWVGVFFGNVPWNFTTSHLAIHHRLQAGIGDTFYQWDFDRSSFSDLQLFLYRIFLHMCSFTSLLWFRRKAEYVRYNRLLSGTLFYWVTMPALIMAITQSWSFLFWIYFQPLFGMTYFLAFMNFAFHAFVDYDEHGRHLAVVNSTCIIDGQDDYFGEDDHMAHHYACQVYYKDLPEYRKTQIEAFKKYHGAVFRGVSIVEMAAFLLTKQWGMLADIYVDYHDEGEKLPRDQLIELLKVRTQRKEMTHREYTAWCEAQAK